MKYIFIAVSLFLISPHFASAVALAPKSVKGTVPQLEPLQPPPAGVHANTVNNIQYTSPDQQAASQNSPAPIVPDNANAEINQKLPGLVSGGSPFTFWIWLLVVLAGAGLLVFAVRKTNRAKK